MNVHYQDYLRQWRLWLSLLMQIQTEMKITTAEVGSKSKPVKRPEPAELTRQSTVVKIGRDDQL
jgi:hypothetical protein